MLNAWWKRGVPKRRWRFPFRNIAAVMKRSLGREGIVIAFWFHLVFAFKVRSTRHSATCGRTEFHYCIVICSVLYKNMMQNKRKVVRDARGTRAAITCKFLIERPRGIEM